MYNACLKCYVLINLLYHEKKKVITWNDSQLITLLIMDK